MIELCKKHNLVNASTPPSSNGSIELANDADNYNNNNNNTGLSRNKKINALLFEEDENNPMTQTVFITNNEPIASVADSLPAADNNSNSNGKLAIGSPNINSNINTTNDNSINKRDNTMSNTSSSISSPTVSKIGQQKTLQPASSSIAPNNNNNNNNSTSTVTSTVDLAFVNETLKEIERLRQRLGSIGSAAEAIPFIRLFKDTKIVSI